MSRTEQVWISSLPVSQACLLGCAVALPAPEQAETVEHKCGDVNCHNLVHLEEMSDATTRRRGMRASGLLLLPGALLLSLAGECDVAY